MKKKRLVSNKKTAPYDPRGTAEPLWDLLLDGVTQGFFETLFACPRKAHLKYREGVEVSKFSYAMKFGNVVHGALDHVYTTFRDTGNSTLAIVSRKASLDADEFLTRQEYTESGNLSLVEQELEEIYASAEVVLSHYFDYYAGDFNGSVKWEALEEVFEYPYTLSTGKGEITVPVRGKVDGRYRSKNGKLWIVDHKAKGQIQPAVLLDRLAIDLQVNLYLWATWKLTGELPAGVLYNVIRRPQLRRKANEPLREFADRIDGDIQKRPEFYFHRYEVKIKRSDMETFEREIYSMTRLAHAWYLGSYDNFRFGPSCETKYGTCEFLPLCGRGERFGLRRRGAVFPELVQLEISEKD